MNLRLSDRKNLPKPALARFLLSVFLIPLAMALLAYGLLANSVAVLPLQDKKTSHIVMTEPQVVRDVTVGGLTRLDSGIIQKTYSGKPPQACPT